jgi:hypothetical protein
LLKIPKIIFYKNIEINYFLMLKTEDEKNRNGAKNANKKIDILHFKNMQLLRSWGGGNPVAINIQLLRSWGGKKFGCYKYLTLTKASLRPSELQKKKLVYVRNLRVCSGC